jgi:ABC-type branched-subunit amino acid transport system ATPase component
VHLAGEELTRVPPHEIVKLGVVQVPEGRRIFARLTVEENLKMGGYVLSQKAEVADGIERAFTTFPAPQGAPQAGRRHALWWRAADAGHGPRTHGQAAHAVA